ncbi:MAG: hypothetical protein KU28_02155 [Sulfurovum sp. PC08-66]|jgi:predicted nucleotidyltransferase|nr:MAG: hypothetical protein KU28_02155 [Sulfurovum sp. PC08-66]
MQKDDIVSELQRLKPLYAQEGLILIGLFGSYAKNQQSTLSDIDIAYRLDYPRFSQKYRDGFSKILRIESIKEELQKIFQTKIDFVSQSNRDILEDIIYV